MRIALVLAMLVGCKYQAPAGVASDGPGDGAQPDDAIPIDAPPGAWLAGWSHRKSITIKNSRVSAPTGGLVDFPVLIAFPADPEIAAIAQASGSDLAFTGDDATTPLVWEIERYEAGELAAWVKVPVLDDENDTRLYLYYGNALAPAVDPTAVWSNEFLAVWHMNQNPNAGTAGDIKDSTAASHDGTAESSMTNADVAVGQVGPAIDFDGNNDFIDVPDAVNLNNNFTLSAWVFLSGGTGIKTIFSNSLSGLDVPGCRLFVDSDATSDRMVRFETSNGTAATQLTATSDVNRATAQTWHHIAVIANRTGGKAQIFVDGVDRTVADSIRNDFANNASVELGRMGDIFEWPGVLDEIEIASARRPPEWIVTSYTNQLDPDNFFDIGDQELATD